MSTRTNEPRFSRCMVSSPQTAAGAARKAIADTHFEGASSMPIRLLAFALLAGVCVANAAPPKSKTPKQDAASAQQAPESIDVDALARSKDANGTTPADADAPPAETPAPEAVPPADAAPAEAPPAEAPPVDAAPAETPPTDTAPSEAPPPASVEAAPPVEASAPPAEAPTSAEPPDATAAAPKVDENEKAAVTEKISVAAGCQARAASLLDSAEKGDFNGATSAFDAKMRTALPPPKLKEAWDQLAQFGKLNARGQSHLGTGDGYMIVMIPLIFEKANLVAQIACGTDGRIAGFYVKPAPTAAPNS
jgi:hypothetical protein